MMDWLAYAQERAQAEGKILSLTELIDRAIYYEDLCQRMNKLGAIGCMKDFVSMAEEELRKAEKYGTTGREIDTLRRLCEEVRKEIPDNGE